MVKNSAGEVALKYIQPVQKLVTAPSKRQYVFIPKHNIALAWVQEEDAAPLLSFREGCSCGSGKKNTIREALEHDVRRWQFGGR
jgi:hypothetical protein